MSGYLYPFTSKRLFCACHPETCLCDKFEIVDAKGTFYCGADSHSSAQRILDSLNNPNAHLNQRQ